MIMDITPIVVFSDIRISYTLIRIKIRFFLTSLQLGCRVLKYDKHESKMNTRQDRCIGHTLI